MVFMSFLVSIILVGGMAVYYTTQYYLQKKIAISAEGLTTAKQQMFPDEGYIQAGLTFLEQNQLALVCHMPIRSGELSPHKI